MKKPRKNTNNLEYLGNGIWRRKRKTSTCLYIEKESCVCCGKPYLTAKNHPGNFCCVSCSVTGTNHPAYGKKFPEHSEKMKGSGNPMFGKKRPDTSKRMKNNNPMWDPKIAKKVSQIKIETGSAKGKNNPMYGKKRPEISRNMMGKNNPMYGKTGKNNSNYNPNLTDEERQIRREYIEYKEWRIAIFERDNYTCQCCGKCGGKLAAHHLESYRDNFELRTVLENGITLCEKCHRKFHNQYGYGNNTKEQLEEFLKLRCIQKIEL